MYDVDANIIYYEFEPALIDNTLRPVENSVVNFVGSFSPVTLTAGDKTVLYLGAENTLYWPSDNVTIGACRAYFKLNDLSVAEQVLAAKRFVLNFGEEETTGIISTTDYTDFTDSDDAWYDLSGRRLSGKPSRVGVYINNGRKVVIK